jgi:hypothetical protein
VSRIGLNDAFRMLVDEAGQTPDAAVAEIDQQTKRSNGKFDLWCNGKLLPRDYIRRCVRFELGDNDEIVIFAQMGVGGWFRADNVFKFKLDRDQVEALIAELTPPPPEPERPKRKLGRRLKYDWPTIDPVIREEYEARNRSKDLLAEHVRVRLEGTVCPPADQLRKRIAKLFPDDAQN